MVGICSASSSRFENEINKSKVRMYGSRINILQSSNYNGK